MAGRSIKYLLIMKIIRTLGRRFGFSARTRRFLRLSLRRMDRSPWYPSERERRRGPLAGSHSENAFGPLWRRDESISSFFGGSIDKYDYLLMLVGYTNEYEAENPDILSSSGSLWFQVKKEKKRKEEEIKRERRLQIYGFSYTSIL
jgi:hypothetical protein